MPSELICGSSSCPPPVELVELCAVVLETLEALAVPEAFDVFECGAPMLDPSPVAFAVVVVVVVASVFGLGTATTAGGRYCRRRRSRPLCSWPPLPLAFPAKMRRGAGAGAGAEAPGSAAVPVLGGSTARPRT